MLLLNRAMVALLRAIQSQSLSCNVSVKPTHMGLKLDRNLSVEILGGLAREAQRLGNFVRLDMEDSTCTQETLRIYREPEAIAFQDRQAIRENFLALLEILMGAGCYVGIATHDPWMIQGARGLIARLNVPRERYEFQVCERCRPMVEGPSRNHGGPRTHAPNHFQKQSVDHR